MGWQNNLGVIAVILRLIDSSGLILSGGARGLKASVCVSPRDLYHAKYSV